MTAAAAGQLALFEPGGDRVRHLSGRGDVGAEDGPVHVRLGDGRDRRDRRRTRCTPGDGSCHGPARARPARLPACCAPPAYPGRVRTCAHGFGGHRPSAPDLASCPPLTTPREQMADGPVSRSRTTIRVQHGRPTHDRGRRPERRQCAPHSETRADYVMWSKRCTSGSGRRPGGFPWGREVLPVIVGAWRAAAAAGRAGGRQGVCARCLV